MKWEAATWPPLFPYKETCLSWRLLCRFYVLGLTKSGTDSEVHKWMSAVLTADRQVVARWTGIPVAKLSQGEKTRRFWARGRTRMKQNRKGEGSFSTLGHFMVVFVDSGIQHTLGGVFLVIIIPHTGIDMERAP